MGKKCKCPEPKKGPADWVVTFGDMMSLLLCFFVLIVSFSSMQEAKFQEASLSLQRAFGVMTEASSVIALPQRVVPHLARKTREDVLIETKKLEQSLLDSGLDSEVEVTVTDEGIQFRINAPFLFHSGRAELQPAGVEVMQKLGEFVRRFPYPVRVEGHTDSLPLREGARYGSNWGLSAARAVSVAEFFQRLGVNPGRLAATGFGEFKPIASNDEVAGRSRNRRVEVFLKIEKELVMQDQLPLRRNEE